MFNLFSNSSLWFSTLILIGIIAILIFGVRYWKTGGKYAVISLFVLANVLLSINSIIQLNYYYSAKGGIYGVLSGNFNTNEVEVVDDLAFEFSNIELLETSPGVYSANMILDKVISIDTKESLGVFVNGMPCDITSEVHQDYVSAEYSYTFYDDNKNAILSDKLLLNFSFYDNCTSLKLVCNNSESVEYWHYYFNKNGFKVSIAPLNSISSDSNFTTGDVSNYCVVNYYLDGILYDTKVYTSGSIVELPKINNNYYNWYIGNDLVSDNYILTNNVNLNAFSGDILEAYDVTFLNGDDATTYTLYSHERLVVPEDPVRDGYEFYGWSLDGHFVVEVNTIGYVSDVTYIALFGRIEEVKTYYSFVSGGVVNTSNLKDWFKSVKGYYDVDLEKSIIPVQLCHDSLGMVAGNNYVILTLNSSNINQTLIIDSQVPECLTSGSMTLRVDSDGNVVIDLNTFKIGTNSGNMSANEIKLTTQTNAQIYVITK